MQGSVMEVRWSLRARINYLDTLDFWYRHNKSYAYSQKIIDAVDILEKELKETPYFLANYIRRAFLIISLQYIMKFWKRKGLYQLYTSEVINKSLCN